MTSRSEADRASLLRGVDLLSGLDRVALARLAAYLEPMHVQAGSAICREGERGDRLFLIVAGSFAVLVEEPGGIRQVATIGPGEHAGEMAVLTDEPRAATVVAETDGEVLQLDRARFLKLLSEDAAAGRAVATTLARRLRDRHAPAPAPAAPSVAAPVRVRGPLPGTLRTAAIILAAAAAGAALLLEGTASFVLLLVAAIVVWSTGALPTYLVALGLLAAWLLTGLATAEQALSGYGSSSWLFVFAILGLATAVSRSGLLLRVGLLLVQRVPPGLLPQSAALLATGVALTPLLPLAMGRASITSPLALSVAEALRLEERGRGSAVLGLSAWVGSGPLLFVFLNGSPAVLLVWALLPEATRERFDWIGWLVAAAPLGAIVAAASLGALVFMFRPRPPGRPSLEQLRLQRAVLGGLQPAELGVIGVLGLTLAGWTVGPAYGLDPATVALSGLILAAIVTRWGARELGSLDWGYLLLYGVVLALAGLARDLGLDREIGGAIAGWLALAGVGGPGLVPVAAVLTVIVRSFVPPEQALLLVAFALIPAAQAAGIDPFTVCVAILAVITIWHVPAQAPEYLVAHSTSEGRLFSHGQAQRFAFVYAGIVLAALIAVMPYWRALGLL